MVRPGPRGATGAEWRDGNLHGRARESPEAARCFGVQSMRKALEQIRGFATVSAFL